MNIDRIFLAFVILAVGITIGLLMIRIPQIIDQDDRAETIAAEQGCEYIGNARDLRSVKFMDCNGEVKVYRVKVK